MNESAGPNPELQQKLSALAGAVLDGHCSYSQALDTANDWQAVSGLIDQLQAVSTERAQAEGLSPQETERQRLQVWLHCMEINQQECREITDHLRADLQQNLRLPRVGINCWVILGLGLTISIILAFNGQVLSGMLTLALGVCLGTLSVMREVTRNQRLQDAFVRRRQDTESMLTSQAQHLANMEQTVADVHKKLALLELGASATDQENCEAPQADDTTAAEAASTESTNP